MALHNTQKLDNDLRAGSDEDLALAGLFGIVDGVERIVQDAGLDHCGGVRMERVVVGEWIREMRFSTLARVEVSVGRHSC